MLVLRGIRRGGSRQNRGESDLGLRMGSVLAKRTSLHSADFQFKMCLAAEFIGSRHWTQI